MGEQDGKQKIERGQAKGLPLNVSRSEKNVSLWKITPSVGNAWEKIFPDSQSLGSIIVTVNLLDEEKVKPKVAIVEDPALSRFTVENEEKLKDDYKSSNINKKQETTLELPGCGSETVNGNYSIEEGTLPGCLYVFAETSEGRVLVDGVVSKKFDVKQTFQRKQKYIDTKKQGPKIKETVILHEVNTNTSMIFDMPSRKASAVKAQQNKKVRMEKDELQNILFKLFEKKSRWQLNELVINTLQPREFLRQTVDEICEKVKQGSKLLYELKTEYKTTPMEED